MSVGGCHGDRGGKPVMQLVEPGVKKWSVHKSVGAIEGNVFHHYTEADLNRELKRVGKILCFHQMGLEIRVAISRVEDQWVYHIPVEKEEGQRTDYLLSPANRVRLPRPWVLLVTFVSLYAGKLVAVEKPA
jgi:hypothetical protein